MKIQRALTTAPQKLPTRKQVLQELARDEFQYSRPKMTGLWGAAAGASALAGVGVSKLWELAHLPTNFGPAGMLIGGGVGAAATYFALGDKVDMPKRLGISLAVGAGAAVAWNHFGLNGLKEGVGMAIGGGIGAYVGAKSMPKGQDGLLNRLGAATWGLGICHVAGILGATGGGTGMFALGAFPLIGGVAGDNMAQGNRLRA
ncbi:MAG: hypothetical protein J0I12_25760 [Candidatus Eremiobacteraeota bacterium]|nr:hypothetical protein [Candidatus Eremiobacteraeota bacterium]